MSANMVMSTGLVFIIFLYPFLVRNFATRCSLCLPPVYLGNMLVDFYYIKCFEKIWSFVHDGLNILQILWEYQAFILFTNSYYKLDAMILDLLS